ncbi:MAG: histidine phosphatase family protein [Myxococcales bacterium]|nr:histidine phosphatase family protein [Myxococcales bacterium]
MELLLVRHGLPLRVERADGRPADPSLAPEGVWQARRVARFLARERIAAVVASPLRRAKETAAPLAEALGLDVAVEPRIREADADASSYVPLEELKRDDRAAWEAAIRGGIFGGGDPRAFQRDVVDALEGVIASHPGGRVAVFCHGGVINAWAAHVLGIDDLLFLDARYTSVSRFLAASSGERSVASLNETAHLRADFFDDVPDVSDGVDAAARGGATAAR